MDTFHNLAKVRVAGSNPVVRSKKYLVRCGSLAVSRCERSSGGVYQVRPGVFRI
jgi:hypothetical protein